MSNVRGTGEAAPGPEKASSMSADRRTVGIAIGLSTVDPGDEEAVPCRKAGLTVPPPRDDALRRRDGKIECSADAARGRSGPVFPS
jgi:hypothetical protein